MRQPTRIKTKNPRETSGKPPALVLPENERTASPTAQVTSDIMIAAGQICRATGDPAVVVFHCLVMNHATIRPIRNGQAVCKIPAKLFVASCDDLPADAKTNTTATSNRAHRLIFLTCKPYLNYHGFGAHQS